MGKKYALGNLFLIDDTQDSDASNDHGKAAAKSKPMLDINTDAFKKAVEYIKAGGTMNAINTKYKVSIPCLLYTSPSPRDRQKSRMPSSA